MSSSISWANGRLLQCIHGISKIAWLGSWSPLQDAEAHVALTVNDLPFLLDIFLSIVYNLE